MEGKALPVAVIGAGGFGAFTLAALKQSSAVRLVGVSDRDGLAAQRAGEIAGVPSYTDNRSLLAETKPAIVYLCVPPMAAGELLAACADRGIAVWKEMPLARNLDEAVAFVQRMEKAGLKFAVGTQRRFAVGYRNAWRWLGRLEQIFLTRAHYLFNWGPNLGWRGDRAAAGGGALLELGYHAIDLVLWMMGMPEEVYAVSAGGHRPERQTPKGKPLPPYDTDDTAVGVLRYGPDATAVVAATRASGPVSESICLHGRSGSIIASAESCLLRDPDGNTLDHVTDDAAPVEAFVRQVEAFARAVAEDAKTYECSARENLLTQAVIEAMYLSDRTGQPEVPARLLRTHKLKVADCLALRPSAEVREVNDVPEAPPAEEPKP